MNKPTKPYEVHKLTIPGCDANCKLSSFMELMSPVIPKNYAKECNIPEEYDYLANLEKYLNNLDDIIDYDGGYVNNGY